MKRPGVSSATVRVLYADTDLAGVVYYGTYLRFFEAARTEVLEAAGINIAELQDESGIVFTVTEAALSYHHPARYGDLLRIDVWPTKCGPAKFTLAYAVLRPGVEAPAVTGSTTLCCLDLAKGKPVRLPQSMRDYFTAALEASA